MSWLLQIWQRSVPCKTLAIDVRIKCDSQLQGFEPTGNDQEVPEPTCFGASAPGRNLVASAQMQFPLSRRLGWMPPWKPRSSARKLRVQSASRFTERRGRDAGQGRAGQGRRPLQALAWLCDLLPTYGHVLSRVSWFRVYRGPCGVEIDKRF